MWNYNFVLLFASIAFHARTLDAFSDAGPSQFGVSVIGETSRFLVIDKPHGVPFHSTIRSSEENSSGGDGVVAMVRRAQAEGGIAYQGELFPVHRLDAVTSGCLLFAKDRDAAGKLARGFQRREKDACALKRPLIRKWYVALVNKKSKATSSRSGGVVRGDMAVSRRGAWKILRTTNNPAVTQYYGAGVIISHASVEEESGPLSPTKATPPSDRVVLMSPQTGRTHQLRVALKSLGSPIVGDDMYGGSSLSDRCYLHACAIEIDVAELGLDLSFAPNSVEKPVCDDNGGKINEDEPTTPILFLCPPSSGLKWCPQLTNFPVLWGDLAKRHISHFAKHGD